MDSSPSSRIIHLHVPKTAGTALRVAFEKASDQPLRIFPHYDERKYAGVDPAQYDFFSGHFGFKTAAQLDGRIVTVLRDPVDRFLSVYYFWRQLAERGVEKSRNTSLASRYSLAEFAKIKDEPFLVEEFYNRMTWQIAYGSSIALRRELRDMGKTNDDIFSDAVSNLSKFSVVGVQEQMDDFALAMEKEFSICLKVDVTNVTKVRSAVAELDTSTVHAIHEWSYFDLELYEHARKFMLSKA